MNSTAFHSADMLIPNNTVDMSKWAVIACDQYTAEPEYWQEVEKITNGAPTSLNLILPELYLEQEGVAARISAIHKSMDSYLADGIFTEYKDAMVYVERIQGNGILRQGIVGLPCSAEAVLCLQPANPGRSRESVLQAVFPLSDARGFLRRAVSPDCKTGYSAVLPI